ncbi:MAG: tetratricopeptide repeat protein [Candidatus Solibacter sp.]
MNPAIAIGTWRSMIGIDTRVQSTDPQRLTAARDFLEKVSAIGDQDQLRHRLAEPGSRERNGDLSLILLAEAARMAADGEPATDVLHLLDWLLFVCPYATEIHTFEAHGKALQGILYGIDQQPSRAREVLEEARQLYDDLPGDFRGPQSIRQYCLGAILGDAGNFEAARQALEEARESANAANAGADWATEIEREMQALAAQQLLVMKLSGASSLGEIQHLATAAGSAQPRTLKILHAMALTAGANQRTEDAVRLARAADWLGPLLGETIHSRKDLAEVAMYQLEYGLAEALYRSLLEESPEHTGFRAQLGRAIAQQGRNEEAIEQLMKVLEQKPDDAPALRELGGVYINLSDFPAARHYLEAAAAADPSDALAATMLKSLGSRGAGPSIAYDPKTKQIQISQEMLNLPPDEMGRMLLVAMLKGNPQTAPELLQSIAQEKGVAYAQRLAEMAFPQAAAAAHTHYDRAEQFFATRQIDKALPEYKLAITDNRNAPGPYMGAGDCYYHMGQFNLAAAFFEESVAIRPNPSTLRFLGDAHRKAGRMPQALAAYEQAVELDPSYAPAAEQLRTLKQQMGDSHV